MSEPIRYTQAIKCVEPSYHAQDICSGMVECSIGEWVLHSDYACLKAEVERSRDQYNGIIDTQLAVIDSLKAEVERLTQLNDTLALRYDATNSMLDGCAKEIEEMEAEVERLTKAVMHSPAAQLKLKELEGKTTFEEINGKIPPCIDKYEAK